MRIYFKLISQIFVFLMIFLLFYPNTFSYSANKLNIYKSDGTSLIGKFDGLVGSVMAYDFWGRISAGGQTLNTIAIVISAKRDDSEGRPTNDTLLYDTGTNNFCDGLSYISNYSKKHLITGDCSTFQGRATSRWYYSSNNCTGTVYIPWNGFYVMPTISATEGWGGMGGILSYYYCLSLNHDQKAFWRGGYNLSYYDGNYYYYPNCNYNDYGSLLLANRSYQSYREPNGTCVNATGTIYSLIRTPSFRLCGSIATGTGECVIK